MMKSALSAVLAVLVATPAIASTQWKYEGPLGADRWGQLHSDFELCERGIMQSPVDLGNANAIGQVEVVTNWNASPLTILNNGHTVQVNFSEGSSMQSGEKTFDLVQMHFHTPSEHTIDGTAFPLTAHFVHANDAGELAVLGVMFVAGEPNTELQKLVEAAPPNTSEAMTVEGVDFNPNKLLPENDEDVEVYRYMGSLTTPPCSEGVNWHVVADPVSASTEQIAALEKIMGMNARPVQLLNGRLLVAPE